jgi:predicted phosphodiesterase
MRAFLQKLLTKPVVKLANRISSKPDKRRVDGALSDLYRQISTNNEKRGLVMNFGGPDKFVILSDQHKGARDGADVFALAEKNYLAALAYYFKEGFYYINLGDSEELWENLFVTVKRHNKATFEAEKTFLKANRFYKIFGNHDLYWDNDPLAAISLASVYGQRVPIYEGVLLKTKLGKEPLEVFMTHGHQGDLQSDGNWFSKWFVSDIWAPFQSYLRINPNTPANNDELKTVHNRIMYQWSSKRKNMLLITGHTHQPVFKSLTHLELLYEQLEQAEKGGKVETVQQLKDQISAFKQTGDRMPDFKGYLDTYFNTGCCCFDDGDITGIEIEDSCITLIKWKYYNKKESIREVLAGSRLDELKVCEL